MFKEMFMLALAAAPGAVGAVQVSDGRTAYEINQVAEAERIYVAVLASPASDAEDRATASLELARIAWLIDNDADRALRRLQAGRTAGRRLCELGQLEARVLREAKRTALVTSRGPALLAGCADVAKADLIRLEVVRAHLDAAAAQPASQRAEIAEAASQLAKVSADGSVSLDAAAARLEIGLLQHDSASARKGWRDYFWLSDEAGPPALKALDPTGTIRRGLANRATDDAKVELTYVLMRAGFGEPSRRFAVASGLPGKSKNPHWRLLEAYWHQRETLSLAEARINRILARGGAKDDPALSQKAMAGLGALMAAADADGDPKAAMLKHYGILGSIGQTSGYPSMHLGHVIDERSVTVRQYGHEATVRYAEIDNLWANGFESWLWDGSAATGGWSGDDVIVHVRAAYTSGSLNAYRLVGNTPSRRDLVRQLGKLEAEDLEKARRGSPTTLEGLNARLKLQLVAQIATAARSKGGDFRRAFLDEYWRASLQQSIFTHEGRHAIDKAMAADAKALDDETLEYQAKLSELALSEYPRMALSNINRGIGGSSPHDRAGTRIVQHIADWIRANSVRISKFDRALPAEVQIDKVTDVQLREIAKSLDPLARR